MELMFWGCSQDPQPGWSLTHNFALQVWVCDLVSKHCLWDSRKSSLFTFKLPRRLVDKEDRADSTLMDCVPNTRVPENSTENVSKEVETR